jgi:hypothetical protein
VSWPIDEGKRRITSEEASKNAKKIKEKSSMNGKRKENSSSGNNNSANEKSKKLKAEVKQKRENVAKKFEEALEIAEEEERKIGVTLKNEVENALNPNEIAIGIERALFELCGRDTGKEYGVQARSLMFNLRDQQNPTLRARVLHENVSAESLVRMSPAELANKELIEWRKKREEKIGEDAFLKGVPLEMIKVEKDGKGVSVHVKTKEEIEKEEKGVDTEIPATTPRMVTAIETPFERSKEVHDIEENEDDDDDYNMNDVAADNNNNNNNNNTTATIKEDFISFDAYQEENKDEEEEPEQDEPEGEEEGEEEENIETEEQNNEERNIIASWRQKSEESDHEDEDEEPGEIRALEMGDWSGQVYVKGIDSIPAVALHFSPVGGELALLDKLLPESSTLEIKGRVSLKEAEAFVRQIARQSNSRAVTIAEVETCMVNDKKANEDLQSLAKHYEEKSRAGVSDDKEKKIEVYVFPRKSEEAMRLLKIMRAPGIVIRTENKKSSLLVAVIHKKGIGRNFKVIEAKAEAKRKEAKMKQLENDRVKKMQEVKSQRLREAENYSPPDEGTSDFDEEFSEEVEFEEEDERERKPPPPPPQRTTLNNFGRGLTQTIPPNNNNVPIGGHSLLQQQHQQQQLAPPPPPLAKVPPPQQHHSQVILPPPPQKVQILRHQQAPPPPPAAAVVHVPPPPQQTSSVGVVRQAFPPPPPPQQQVVRVVPPPPAHLQQNDISQLLAQLQQQQQQGRIPPPPPPKR